MAFLYLCCCCLRLLLFTFLFGSLRSSGRPLIAFNDRPYLPFYPHFVRCGWLVVARSCCCCVIVGALVGWFRYMAFLPFSFQWYQCLVWGANYPDDDQWWCRLRCFGSLRFAVWRDDDRWWRDADPYSVRSLCQRLVTTMPVGCLLCVFHFAHFYVYVDRKQWAVRQRRRRFY